MFTESVKTRAGSCNIQQIWENPDSLSTESMVRIAYTDGLPQTLYMYRLMYEYI